MEFMRTHPDQIVKIDELMVELRAEPDAIRRCISNLIKAKPEFPIMVEQRGMAWSFQSKVDRVIKRKFTEVGTSSAGMVIVEDSAGILYSLKELS